MKKHEMNLAVTVKEVEHDDKRIVREVAIEANDVTPELLAAAIDALIFKFKHIYCVGEDD